MKKEEEGRNEFESESEKFGYQICLMLIVLHLVLMILPILIVVSSVPAKD